MFNDVVDFISPFFAYESERAANLLNAFNDHEAVLRKINYSGAASDFVPRLVRVLQHHGEITRGTQALWQLLLTLKGQVGVDKQETIDSFQTWANAAHKITLQPGDLAGSTVVNNDNRIRIGGNVTGGNVNIGGNQTIHGNVTVTMGDLGSTIQKGPAALSDKEILQNLVNELKALLQSVPAIHKDAAERVSERTAALVHETSVSDVDLITVKRMGERLLLAAGPLKDDLPKVLDTGERIAVHAVKMAGG